ncbi:MAG: PEP-CTERM sorting domain-containing protein [Burkholderiales bacterium]
MTKHFLTRIAASVAIATASMAAAADVIDFTSSAWSGANGVNSYSLNGVTLTAQPNGPFDLQRLTFNSGSCGNTLVGLACQGAGIGVGPVDPTQINVLPEALRVGFSSAQSIWGVDFLKFVSTAVPILGSYSERMQIRSSTDGTNFGAWQTFTAPDPSATGGYYSANFRADNVLALEIAGRTFGSGFSTNATSAASLARITVPVPAALPLIGLGLAAFGGLSLRRRAV